MEKLSKLYYDPKFGLSSASDLHKKLNGEFTMKQIKDFLKSQDVNQLYTNTNNKKLFYPIIGNVGSYQADLTFFEGLKRANGGYGVLLTCINIMTRKAFVKPLKNKSGDEVINSFKEIIKEAEDMKTLTTDNGSEFISKKFTDMLKKEGIDLILADATDKNKMGKIERFNRTIRNKIEKYMTAYKTNKYIDVLPDLVYNYNHSIHSRTGYAPEKVGVKEEKNIYIDEKQRNRQVDINKIDFIVGDRVRLLKSKDIFDKKGGEKYYRGLYEIIKVNAMSYKLKNEKGDVIAKRAKHYELVKANNVEILNIEKPVNPEILKKQVKVQRELKKEGIQKANLINVGRRTQKVDGLDLSNIVQGKRRK